MFMKLGVVNQKDDITGCSVNLLGTEVIRFCVIYLEKFGKFKP